MMELIFGLEKLSLWVHVKSRKRWRQGILVTSLSIAESPYHEVKNTDLWIKFIV